MSKRNIGLLWLLFAGALFTLQISSCSIQSSQDQSYTGSPAETSKVTVDNVGRLTGVNWFGFETGNLCPHGLWSRDYKSMLKQIKDLGFNCIRLPWCNSVLSGTPNSIQINADGVDAYTGQKGLNLDLAGLSSIQVMDKIIDEATRVQGLKIILDNHSLKPDDYMNETLWYTSDISESKWISDWVTIVNRYKNNSYVCAADLKNEPHGNLGTGMKPPATWGYTAEGYNNTDWKAAAERCASSILQANPNIIIIVEGVEEYKGDYYWWGGNLKGVADYPITSIPKSQLMYSFHEYGPEVYNQSWFSDPTFPNNMPAIWDTHFWFIYKQNIAPLFLGEFGIKEESAANASSVAGTWFRTLMSYVGSKCHWTFWCMNPNSGDTGGILKDDWVSVNTAKYGVLKGYLAAQFAPLGGSSSSVSSAASSIASSRSSAASSVSSSRSSAVSSVASSRSSVASSISSSRSSAVSSAVTSSVSSVQYTEISIPFTKDGAGEFYWKTKGFSTTPNDYSHYVNSWNMDILEINGTSYVNKWVPTFQIPAASDGYWYIRYKGSYSYSHMEIK